MLLVTNTESPRAGEYLSYASAFHRDDQTIYEQIDGKNLLAPHPLIRIMEASGIKTRWGIKNNSTKRNPLLTFIAYCNARWVRSQSISLKDGAQG